MEDKITEFEERIRIIYSNCVAYNKGAIGFIQDLRKIMPPVCTPNDRKFLDEIREKAKLIRPNVYAIFPEPLKIRSVIFAKDFEANLSELVEGKDE
jgi:hypothetical protein